MILLLLIRCWLLLPLKDSVIVLYFVTLCPFLFFNHLDGEERELAALLSLSSWGSWLLCGYSSQCHGFVCSLLLWYLSFLVSFMQTAMALATFAWSSLSLRHSLKFSCGDSNGGWMPFCASSEGSGESAHLHRLTLAFVTVQNLLCCLKWRFVCYSRQQRILWWVCTFAQAVTGQCNKYQALLCWQQRLFGVCTGSPEPSIQYRNIMCWLKWRFLQRLCEQQMMCWVCTSNHRNSVQPSVRCINASKNAPSAL